MNDGFIDSPVKSSKNNNCEMDYVINPKKPQCLHYFSPF